MRGRRRGRRADRCKLLSGIGPVRLAHERSEASGKLCLEGRPSANIDLRTGRGLDRALDRRLGAIFGRHGREPGPGNAHDIRFDDDVVRTADEKKVLDIVATQKNELPLPVEIVDVDDAEPRLARASPVLSLQHQPSACQAAKDDAEQGNQDEDDGERYDILGCLGRFDTKSRQHDELSRARENVRRPASRHLSNTSSAARGNEVNGWFAFIPKEVYLF